MSILVIKDGLVAADTKHVLKCGYTLTSQYYDKIIIDKSGKFAIAYTGYRLSDSSLSILLNRVRIVIDDIHNEWAKVVASLNIKETSVVLLLKDSYLTTVSPQVFDYSSSYVSGSDEGVDVLINGNLSATEIVIQTSKYNTWIGGEVIVFDPSELKEVKQC